MKEKNKKGLFHLLHNVIRSSNSSEEPSDASEALQENSEEEVAESAAETTVEKTASADEQASDVPVPDTETIPKAASIWGPSDDPLLVRVDEDLLQIECNQFTSKMRSLSAVFKRTAVTETEQKPKAAQPQLFVSRDYMAAWFYIIPPVNNGSDITEADLKAMLAKERITKGIMEDALISIVEQHLYDQAVLVAKGTLARNGVDGSVKDHFKRVVQLELKEDEKGAVDFKNLNNIQSVKEGEVICEITPAIPGVNGLTITGQSYPCDIKGTEAVIPAGRNTTVSEDRTLLLSQKTGHITFVGGKFQVDPLLKINGNVDNNTGNLDYDGDILIAGDVRNGFSVKATGSISIRGSVEGAQITACGPITIASGMSGNGRGVLTSDSDIKCRYLEHCTVSAGGNIYAESIINSKVESGQDVVVTSGIGVIIGGSILASCNINARIIGSKARRLITELIIASAPKNVEEANKLTQELEQLHRNRSEIAKNISYLESSKRQDKQQLLESLKLASNSLNIREREITSRLEELTAEANAAQAGLIQCQQLLPVVRVRIGSASLMVQEEYSKSILYKNNEGEIVIGSN